MSTPSVTIKVGGVTVTPTTTTIPTTGGVSEESLYMMYVQATRGDIRNQWVVFPPAVEGFGVRQNMIGQPSTMIMLARKQMTEGNRSKWFHHRLYSGDTLVETLERYKNEGYFVSTAIAVPLEVDDYLKVWNDGKTPHKAMRAIDRALIPFGIQVK